MSYVWWVIVGCRRVGYVRSPSEMGAVKAAREQFGKTAWVERYSDMGVCPPNPYGCADCEVVS